MESLKDSKVQWIGDIPNDWEVLKVKHTATSLNSLFIDGDWIETEHIKEEGIRYLTSGNVGVGVFKEQGDGHINAESFKTLKCLEVIPGDLMISRLNKPLGRSCIVPQTENKYVVAVDNVILRPNKNIDKLFLNYLMNTDGYAAEADLVSRGATMKRISRSILGELWITLPPYSEQKEIVSCLDIQCSKIDSIITKIEKQISLLQDYKKSLITEVVTKGLDPTMPMRDSGVEWIGDIPDHWVLKKLNYLAKFKTGGTPSENIGIDEEGEYPWFTASDMDNGLTLLKSSKYISYEAVKSNRYKLFPSNSILLVCIASVGKIGITLTDSYSNQQITAIIPHNIEPQYLLYFLVSISEKIISDASSNVVPIINTKYLKQIQIPVPSRTEQIQISSFLDNKVKIINTIVIRKQKQLEFIKEHKKSLIYEYVTGKKRVGGYGDGN